MSITITGLGDPTTLPGSSRYSMREALKEQWLPAQEAYLASKDTEILGIIGTKSSEELAGRQSVFYAATNRPQGIGARGERNRLPTPTSSKGINGYLHPKKAEGRLEITPELERDARGGNTAWVQAFTNELEGISEQMEMEITDMAVWGRSNTRGRLAAAPSAGGVLTLYGRNNRGATASRFMDRGMNTLAIGPANQPFFENQRLSIVPSTQGFNGQPHDHATDGWASGDINDDTSTQEVYIKKASDAAPLDGSTNTAPTISVFRNGAAVDLSAVANSNGGWLIPYGSRQVSPSYATAETSIDQFFATEGLASMLAGSSIYSAVYDLLKSSSIGLQAKYSTGDVAGTERQVSNKLIEFAIRSAGMQTGGGSPSYVSLLSWAQWGEVAKETENLRRFEPVLGNGGTNMVGNTPEGYRYIGGGGGAVYKPSWAAIHRAIVCITPEHWSYMENMPLHMLEPDGRLVPDYDTKQYVWMRRGNFKCDRIMKEAFIDDLAEDEFAPTA